MIGRSALEAFVEDFVELEFPPRDDVLARGAARWVGERAVCAAAVARIGLLVPAVTLDLVAFARYAKPYAKLAHRRRLQIAGRLARTQVPLAVDWVRAVRLLAAAFVFEQRFG